MNYWRWLCCSQGGFLLPQPQLLTFCIDREPLLVLSRAVIDPLHLHTDSYYCGPPVGLLSPPLTSLALLVSRRIMSPSLLSTSAPVPPICIPPPSAALRQPAPSILIKVPPTRVQSEVTNISIGSCLKQESHSRKERERKKKNNFISLDVGGEGRRGRNQFAGTRAGNLCRLPLRASESHFVSL